MTSKKQSQIDKNRIINSQTYIWSKNEKDLALELIAKHFDLSSFHFHRLFTKYTKESLHSHLNRIKLEQSAIWLKYTNKKIIDIAIEIGYNSREGFTRAFKAHFKETPMVYRKKSQQKIQKIILKSGLNKLKVKVKIIKSSSIKVAFIRANGDYMKTYFNWLKLKEWIKQNSIDRELSCIGVTYDDPDITPSGKLRYDACIEIEDSFKIKKDDTVCKQELNGGIFAQVEFEGNIYDEERVWEYLTYIWLPQNNYYIRDYRFQTFYRQEDIPSNLLEAFKIKYTIYKATLKLPISKTLVYGFPPI